MPSLEGAVPLGGLRGQLGYQLVVLHRLEREPVGGVVPGGEGLDIDELPGSDLVMDVPEVVHARLVVAPYVFRGEFQPVGVGTGDDVHVQAERQEGDDARGNEVRDHHPAVAHAAAEDGDDLAVRGHPGGEEDHRDEDEQRREHVYEVRDVVKVVVEDDRTQRGLVLDEVIDVLRQVDDDDDADDEQQRYEEGQDELLDDVAVDYLQSEIHFRCGG